MIPKCIIDGLVPGCIVKCIYRGMIWTHFEVPYPQWYAFTGVVSSVLTNSVELTDCRWVYDGSHGGFAPTVTMSMKSIRSVTFPPIHNKEDDNG